VAKVLVQSLVQDWCRCAGCSVHWWWVLMAFCKNGPSKRWCAELFWVAFFLKRSSVPTPG
jgi:hypothetical protein